MMWIGQGLGYLFQPNGYDSEDDSWTGPGPYPARSIYRSSGSSVYVDNPPEDEIGNPVGRAAYRAPPS